MKPKRVVADLHLHSRYSLATSPALDLRTLAQAARVKGIDVLAAPDFTHPAWREEMRSELVPLDDATYRAHGATFILVTEIACIWKHDGRSRRVHILLMAPGLAAADAISVSLARYQRLESDGRPMIKASARELCDIAWEADERCVLIPAHVWTPWYGVYGSKSGFDSLEECFGDYAAQIPAVETGLSSDPAMNWAVPDIDGRSIVSFSDAHSARTVGRELTIFDAEPTYESLRAAIINNGVRETVEFHPEHGKYHLNGHRKCGVRLTPEQTPEDGRCRVCGRPLTIGVLQRVAELSGNSAIKGERPAPGPSLRPGPREGTSAPPLNPLQRAGGERKRLTYGPPGRAPFRSLVPLAELLAHALEVGPGSKRVLKLHKKLIDELGSELHVLTTAEADDVARVGGERAAAAIMAVRDGRVSVEPGYDGEYGSVIPLSNSRQPGRAERIGARLA